MVWLVGPTLSQRCVTSVDVIESFLGIHTTPTLLIYYFDEYALAAQFHFACKQKPFGNFRVCVCMGKAYSRARINSVIGIYVGNKSNVHMG